MPNITLSVPEHLHRKMKRHPEVNWSEVVRRLIAERLRDLESMDKITAKSGLAPADVKGTVSQCQVRENPRPPSVTHCRPPLSLFSLSGGSLASTAFGRANFPSSRPTCFR